MIKAILFDVDGVLVNEESKYFSHHLEEEFGIPRKLTLQFFDGEFMECIEGKKDLKEILPHYLDMWGWKVTVEEALHYWHTKEHVINDPLLHELEGFKKKGIKLYIGTNQEKYRTAYITEEMGFGKIMDQIFASYGLGHRKPAKEYFQKILETLVIFKPHDVLFWDDRQENIDAARDVGLHGELYQSFPQFKQVMKDKYEL